MLDSAAFLASSTLALALSFSSLLSLVSASISDFSLLAASVKSDFAFSLALSNSVLASTVLSASNVFVDVSGYVTVTFPFSSTEISLSFNVGFVFLTASFTAVFSSSVRLFGLLTFTFVGGVNGDFAASVPSTGTSTVSFEPSW